MNKFPTPEEHAFMKAFNKLLDKMPPSLWLFVTGDIYIMKRGAQGEQVMDGLSPDQDYIVGRIDGKGRAEGGGW